MTLTRATATSDGDWKAVALLMTKSHIVVTGSDGSVEWLTLPAVPGLDLEVFFCLRWSVRAVLATGFSARDVTERGERGYRILPSCTVCDFT